MASVSRRSKIHVESMLSSQGGIDVNRMPPLYNQSNTPDKKLPYSPHRDRRHSRSSTASFSSFGDPYYRSGLGLDTEDELRDEPSIASSMEHSFAFSNLSTAAPSGYDSPIHRSLPVSHTNTPNNTSPNHPSHNYSYPYPYNTSKNLSNKDRSHRQMHNEMITLWVQDRGFRTTRCTLENSPLFKKYLSKLKQHGRRPSHSNSNDGSTPQPTDNSNPQKYFIDDSYNQEKPKKKVSIQAQAVEKKETPTPDVSTLILAQKRRKSTPLYDPKKKKDMKKKKRIKPRFNMSVDLSQQFERRSSEDEDEHSDDHLNPSDPHISNIESPTNPLQSTSEEDDEVIPPHQDELMEMSETRSAYTESGLRAPTDDIEVEDERHSGSVRSEKSCRRSSSASSISSMSSSVASVESAQKSKKLNDIKEETEEEQVREDSGDKEKTSSVELKEEQGKEEEEEEMEELEESEDDKFNQYIIPMNDNTFFIDRNGELFSEILEYLRTQKYYCRYNTLTHRKKDSTQELLVSLTSLNMQRSLVAPDVHLKYGSALFGSNSHLMNFGSQSIFDSAMFYRQCRYLLRLRDEAEFYELTDLCNQIENEIEEMHTEKQDLEAQLRYTIHKIKGSAQRVHINPYPGMPRDLSWLDTDGPYNGIRRIPGSRIAFAVAKDNYCHFSTHFDPPQGFTWASQAEYLSEHERSDFVEPEMWVFYGEGGWKEYTWKHTIKVAFLFRDTFQCGRYIHAGMHIAEIAHVQPLFGHMSDAQLVDYDEQRGIIEGFAGVVLLSTDIFRPKPEAAQQPARQVRESRNRRSVRAPVKIPKEGPPKTAMIGAGVRKEHFLSNISVSENPSTATEDKSLPGAEENEEETTTDEIAPALKTDVNLIPEYVPSQKFAENVAGNPQIPLHIRSTIQKECEGMIGTRQEKDGKKSPKDEVHASEEEQISYSHSNLQRQVQSSPLFGAHLHEHIFENAARQSAIRRNNKGRPRSRRTKKALTHKNLMEHNSKHPKAKKKMIILTPQYHTGEEIMKERFPSSLQLEQSNTHQVFTTSAPSSLQFSNNRSPFYQ